ncbi:hypothetical protein HID58_008432 [Brassica napus]|uniref:(rape) hypothetical protein n=1 Tax=Brassica napus TaxID=3708 RepID=A0A816VB10_BRANA|nr:uncharacterized protein LOC125596640 [Brassica napus]KAH0853315.1 hypothetical protein HID58_093297 [Brassica napus]KAH0887982.1 hypothetical protein HID58_050411 [Brassica napus]KAH0931315.1 hypothetical protein HID58_008432 [Brassica napus]CAF2119095.1 unnamed protein product [Brassica napus]
MEKRRREEMITEAEMEAAQYLMELSDEETSLEITKKRKIEEIFGKDDIYQDQCTKEMVIVRVMSPKKKKKFRTLESIYKATRPIYQSRDNKMMKQHS